MPTINLLPDGSLPVKEINDELYRLLDEYSIETYPAEHRNHLGVSLIGDPCARKLWYTFRWVKLDQAEPRMRRLWSRGHREEEVFKTILTWMGFFVREIDKATNRQYRFSKINGHYGGSSDSLALLPWFRGDNDPKILVEYKTHNNKSFTKLKADKLRKSKPLHYDQMCCYAREFNTRYGLYCAVNKDNDEIYFEFLELDWNRGIELENKASDIIKSQVPPPKFSDNPAMFECTWCSFKDICHYGAALEKNCRSCKFALPVEDGKWKCSRWNDLIPKEHIKTGCPEWNGIN